MNTDRLLKLADLLEADANNPNGIKFDLAFWALHNDSDDDCFPTRLKKLDCRTAACAVGLACLSGAFKKEGFTWKPSVGENNIDPIYRGASGFRAVEGFFDLDGIEAVFLFVHSRYPGHQRSGAEGELAVAQRIRDFVAGKVEP